MIPAALLAGAVAAPIVTGYLGDKAASGDRKKAMQMQQQALDNIMSIQVPEERALMLEKYKSAGIITPEAEQAILQEGTGYSDIALDPATREAQMSALSGLQRINEEGGMTMQDRANLSRSLGQIQQAERGSRDAAMMAAQRRGMGGSGMSLAAALNASQNAAQQGSQNALDIEGQAQNRALQSLMQAGQLGGQIGAQDYAQQAQLAEAQDAMSRFNVANRADVQQRNVGNRNTAQAANLANKQDIMSSNVDTGNQARLYNQQAGQRRFDNELNKAGLASGQYNNMAKSYGDQAQGSADKWSGIGSGISSGALAYGLYGDRESKATPAKKSNVSAKNVNRSLYNQNQMA